MPRIERDRRRMQRGGSGMNSAGIIAAVVLAFVAGIIVGMGVIL